MRAMTLTAGGPIESFPLVESELPPPVPGAGEVRVRVHCCAICRTDLHVVEGDLPAAKRPVVPGHQIVGTVDQVGPACVRLRAGMRVGIAWLRSTDGTCAYCRGGSENLCPASRYTGYHEDGGYAEYAVVREDFAYEIPSVFSDAQAAPLLCAGIIGYRAMRRANVERGGKVALLGFGSSAHIVLQLARHRGCRVYVVSRGENHRRLAMQMGADWAGADAGAMPAKADSAIVFAPAGEVVLAALSALKPGGTAALAGIHMSPIPAIDYDKYLYGERDMHPVTANTREDGRKLLAEAAAAGLKMHVREYALADANRALVDLKAGGIEGTGVLLLDSR